jgi:hypothetical protein
MKILYAHRSCYLLTIGAGLYAYLCPADERGSALRSAGNYRQEVVVTGKSRFMGRVRNSCTCLPDLSDHYTELSRIGISSISTMFYKYQTIYKAKALSFCKYHRTYSANTCALTPTRPDHDDENRVGAAREW